MAVSDYSTNPNDNVSIGGVNIAELCPPGNLNNAIRSLAADVRTVLNDTALGLLDDLSYGEMRTTLGVPASTDALTSLAALAPAADRLPFFSTTGPAAGALAAFPYFARVLVSAADAPTARATLGAISVAALSLANPGYIRFDLGGLGQIQLAWGSFVANANGGTTVNYAAPFPVEGFPVISGCNDASTGAQDNLPAVQTASAGGFNVWNASNSATTYYVAAGF